jgi:glutaredoxin 3
MEQKPVSIYTTSTCHFCQMSKELFKANNIQYTEYNVGTDPQKRQEMIEKSGQMGVPVIFIGDDMVIGFDKKRLDELLGLGAAPEASEAPAT